MNKGKQKVLPFSKDDSSHGQMITTNELEMYLQPQIEVETGKVVSAEALVRWRHPDGHLVYPDEFIPAMERDGSIEALDFFVLECACKHLRKWYEKSRDVVPIAVNQSQIYLGGAGYVQRICEVIEKWDINPKDLVLEFTESALCKEEVCLARTAEMLHDIGFRVAIDDFGVGYSSMMQLKNIAVDIVKLDRSFLVRTERNHLDCILLEKTLELVHALGVKTLCEGVERPEQDILLRKLGCNLAQGYLYGKPMLVEQFEKECLIQQQICAAL
ncbi:MAG: EAL domain-containing protein [Oscillospiraceae bacterium]